MESRRTLIFTGLLILIILLLVVGTGWYVFNFLRNRQSNSNIFPTSVSESSPTPSASSIALASPTPAGSVAGVSTSNGSLPSTGVEDSKIYTGQGFQVIYPGEWGLLTCNDSQNFELDPIKGTDQLLISCNYAVKPITFLVNNNVSCSGNLVALGNIQVYKTVKNTARGVNYQWCTKTTPSLDITHRVSSAGGTATSKTDYSKEVEQMISVLKFNNQ